MNLARGVTYGSIGVIVLLSLSSGPIGVFDFATERDTTAGIGQGSLEITEVTAPETASLQQGEYGSESYYLQVPDAVLTLDSIEGRPVVSYKINIPELGYSRETAHFLSSDSGQRVVLSVEKDTLPPEDVQADEYQGELRVVVRANDENTVVHRRNVTVDVQR
jgi:hypothetical protein